MYRIVFFDLHEPDEDFTDSLLDMGAAAVSNERAGNKYSVTALFDDLSAVRNNFSEGEYSVETLTAEEWTGGWKKAFAGYRVDSGIYVAPPEGPGQGFDGKGLVIKIDPGASFGTGSHPSTTLCLRMIRKHLGGLRAAERARLSALDAGTGSGILSVLMSLMGVGMITAVDVDPESIGSAEKNFSLNGCGRIVLMKKDAAGIEGEDLYGLIAANLTSDIIMENLDHLGRLLKRDGVVIAGGIIDSMGSRMEDFFKSKGWIIKYRLKSRGWLSYAMTMAEGN